MSALTRILLGLSTDVAWVLDKAIKIMKELPESEQGHAARVLLREAEARKKVQLFDEAMRKVPKP